MILAFDGSSLDGSVYTEVVALAHHSPTWLDGLVSGWSAYGLALFAVLMVVAWWRARGTSPSAAVLALAAPVIVVLAYAVDDALKLAVREDRPCQSLHVITLEACPAPGDWSFPSNHAAIAAAAAVALLAVGRRLGSVAVGRRLGLVAVLAACAMALSRIWVGAHYPHDVVAGALVGTLVAAAAVSVLRRWPDAVARRITATRLRPLLTTS
ncbi:phosphatase PAP2 family protein [Streptomyces sp. NPDC000151]|uniref:phosphatase PAP2 family protein n=1 Tax=Streptomyces sp. NPDC000151 TaxID=3154244 RepID=UPI003326337C